jgi:formylglycine-generating enzyme required for sulfatase activity
MMLLAPAILAAAPALLAQKETPPGMVLIDGGRTEVGNDRKVIEEMLETNPRAEGFIRALDAETPGHTVSLEDYFIGATEVTNEQYAEYVKATGAAPPYHWGAKATEEARVAFFQDRENKGKTFDPAKWWEDNWQEHAWEIDPDDLLRPVIFVNYQEAQNFCVWAGLRLPTEAEYQRAVRGKGKDFYPWGMEWKDNACSSAEYKADNAVLLAGMFPEGATAAGIHDLAGNVWEWTSDPYSPYPGFKPGKYKVGKEKLEPQPTWNADWRVAVGGSYQNDKIAARCTTRRGTDRYQRTSGIGFRAAASLVAGKDLCERLYEREVRNSPAREIGTEFNTSTVFAMDRWQGKASAFTGIQSAKLKRRGHYSKYEVPTTYGVIERYEYLVFSPVALIEEANEGTWKRATVKTGPAALGFLATSEPISSPALQPGTYIVSFRAAGKPEAVEAAAEGEGDEGDGATDKYRGAQDDEGLPVWMSKIDPMEDNLLFFDAKTGELAASLPVRKAPEITKGEGAGWSRSTEKVEVTGADGKRKFEEQPRLTLRAEVPHRLRGKVLAFEVQMTVEPGLMDRAGWRGLK